MNKDEIARKRRIQYNIKNTRLKRKEDPYFKLKHDLGVKLGYTIGVIKKSQAFFGCDLVTFIQHIESRFLPGMSWENHGKIWEIDHMISVSHFNLFDEIERDKCFHYTNLQPLFKTTKIAESLGYKDQIGNRNKGKKVWTKEN